MTMKEIGWNILEGGGLPQMKRWHFDNCKEKK